MTDETMPSRLGQETRNAAEAWGRAQKDVPAEPRFGLAGQVLILPALAEPRLAWAVLRRKEGEDGSRLLVAADVNPLVGSGDVAVTDTAVGALTLRCRFAVWLSGGELGATLLLGTLPAESLALAEARWQAIEAGRRVGTFSEQETEEDPEYQDWIEDVVRPAVAKLEALVSTEAPSPPALPFPTRRTAEAEKPRRAPWLRWAAVLAIVGLGTGSGFLWWRQGQEIDALRSVAAASEAAHRQAIADVEARRGELEAQYQARLAKAGEDRTRLEAEHLAQVKELEATLARLRQSTEVKNPVVVTLESDTVRRGPEKLTVGPEVSHLVLLLQVDDPAGTEFQVEVLERRSGKRVWVQKGLQVDVLGEVRLGLPAALLPPADYRLLLFRKEGGAFHLLREHVLDVERESPRRSLPR